MTLQQVIRPGRLRDERGAVASMIAVLGFAIFASLALVVDGGRQLGALTEARDIADNAARFGSQAVDADAWRDTGRPIIDEPDAEARVQDYMNRFVLANATARVVPSTGPDADTMVTVEVTLIRTSFFFPAAPAVATQSATALDGVVGP
jgi:Flp pilus assembly protein TadG